MAEYRTTVEVVRRELESEEVPIDELTGAQAETLGLQPANLFVDEELADSGMSEGRLELIERYLAAHFILTSGVEAFRQVTEERFSDMSSATYAGGDLDGEALRSTTVGQKAIMFDTTGTLDGLGKDTAGFDVPRVKSE